MKFYICNDIKFLGGQDKSVDSLTSACHYKLSNLPKSTKAKKQFIPIKVFNSKTHKDYAMVTPIIFLGNDNNSVTEIAAAKSFGSYSEANDYVNKNNVSEIISDVIILDSKYKKYKVEKPCEDIVEVENAEIITPPQGVDVIVKYPRKQFSAAVRGRIYSKYNGICQICGKPVNRAEMSVDHIIPLSKGGTNLEDNLQLSHDFCNKMKGSYDENECVQFGADIVCHSLLNNPDINLVFKLARSIVRGVNKKGVA